jgi:hypothetical protein
VKPLLAVFVFAAATLVGHPASAHDAYSDAESNPLKIASYPVAVAGYVLEWMITRPVHFLASQPALRRPLNYEPTYNALDIPDPYLPSEEPVGQYQPQNAPASGYQEIVPRD